MRSGKRSSRSSRPHLFFYRVRNYWYGRKKRCDYCGRRKHWNDAWHSYPSGDRVWHSECMAYTTWRGKALERIKVLDLICEVWGITMRDVTELASGRAAQGPADGPETPSSATSDAWNMAWRVMYDLDNHRKAGHEVVRGA
jgi:hypothetical protein